MPCRLVDRLSLFGIATGAGWCSEGGVVLAEIVETGAPQPVGIVTADDPVGPKAARCALEHRPTPSIRPIAKPSSAAVTTVTRVRPKPSVEYRRLMAGRSMTRWPPR